MPIDPPSVYAAVYAGILLLAGLGCCFHFLFKISPKIIPPGEGKAPAWPLAFSDLLLGFFAILMLALLATAFLQALAAERVEEQVLGLMAAGGAQVAALAGLLIFWKSVPTKFSTPFNSRPISWWHALKYALYTFFALLPILWILSLAWRFVITSLGLPADQQEPITWFQEAETMAMLGAMIALTILLAPLAEELLFRGCLYRFLKSKMPLAIAIVVNGALFAILHFNVLSLVPLLFLGMVMAYAYERTGNLKVPILIHGIFNANTVVLILLSSHLE